MTHPPPYFAFAEAMQALGVARPEHVQDVWTTATRSGEVLFRLPHDHAPLRDTPREGWLLTWPNFERGLAILIEKRDDGRNAELVAGWPFSIGGEERDLIVRECIPEAGSFATILDGEIGALDLTLFDSFCMAAARLAGLHLPTTLAVFLHGWAAEISYADTTPMRVCLHPRVLAEFDLEPDSDGKVEIGLEGAATISPAFGVASPLYRVRGPVTHIRHSGSILGRPIWTATVTVARELGDVPDLDIPISFTDAVWAGPPPSVGQDIEALAWLQCAFAPE